MVYLVARKLKQRASRLAPIRRLLSKIAAKICSRLIRVTDTDLRRVTLGSKYGSWTFLELPGLNGATAISCGAGEDISFDVEFATKYRAKVFIVDPTPRSVCHVKQVLTQLGCEARCNYSDEGLQPIDAYNLSQISTWQLILVEKAVWIDDALVRFYPPNDPTHVSYSIIDIQNQFNIHKCRRFLEVRAITIEQIVRENSINSVDIIKLDIEGAELTVIPNLLESSLRPQQILVEYDGFNYFSMSTWRRIKLADQLLRQEGYLCYNRDGDTNFLYARHPAAHSA